jgi:hypothetical protein
MQARLYTALGWLFGLSSSLSLVARYSAGEVSFATLYLGLAAANGVAFFFISYED